MADDRKQRELPLPPGTYAYILDGTKGSIKTHVGPCTLTLTNQDKPVRFGRRGAEGEARFKWEDCSLEEAVQQCIVAPQGFYVELLNPAVAKTGQMDYPVVGRPNDTPDFLNGEKVNIPGPVMFALFPGQTADLRRGHHIALNEFLRIKIYDEKKARENWGNSVVKGDGATVDLKAAPDDIADGKQYNIEGKNVSFYIPPTGVSIVPDSETGEFVRAAETLEQLEYSILVDEDGNKEYPRGPAVVFPRPTQRFLKDTKGNRKFRAVELNELQGIQLKFTKEVELTFADSSKPKFKAGEEAFITGKEMPIYFPEEGHQLVRYDGKSIHYAVAVPDGEARYVMNRKTGKIETVRGPTMLLPNPVTHIIVRRALSDAESMAMFPGADGTGSRDALAYNQWLRGLAAQESTTRQGVVGEGSVERSVGGAAPGSPQAYYAAGSPVVAGMAGASSSEAAFDALESFNNAAVERGVSTRRVTNKSAMSESRQGKQQEAMLADVAERKSQYNEPRTLTFASKKGVPTIKAQQGYAVQVADSNGNRRVVEGPKTILLEYAETLDVLRLSTGKPKSTDKLFATAYLNVSNNKITDVIEVETSDHVKVRVKLIYNVNFEGDKSLWFSIDNYVKYFCDHARSVLKGRVRKLTIEDFYRQPTDYIRDYILGAAPSTAPATTAAAAASPTSSRPGMKFEENGMRATDVEVLAVDIADEAVARLLQQRQRDVVEQSILLAQARGKLEMSRANEEIKQLTATAVAETEQKKLALDEDMLQRRLAFGLAQIEAEIKVAGERLQKQRAEEAINDLGTDATVERNKRQWAAEDDRARQLQAMALEEVRAKTQAIVDQMKSIDPALAAALMSTSSAETLVRVAESLSFHTVFGGENVVDVIRKAFAGNPLGGLLEKAVEAVGAANGSVKTPPAPRTTA